MSFHDHWIVNDGTTITATMTTDIEPTTEGDRTMAMIDIVMITIEPTMIMTDTMTTGMTTMNRVIHQTIIVTPIKVREIINSTMTIVAKNLLTPNRVGPFPTMS